MERDILINVARTSLRTKVPKELADHLTEVYIFINIILQLKIVIILFFGLKTVKLI